jgi:hypothetical protein
MEIVGRGSLIGPIGLKKDLSPSPTSASWEVDVQIYLTYRLEFLSVAVSFQKSVLNHLYLLIYTGLNTHHSLSIDYLLAYRMPYPRIK